MQPGSRRDREVLAADRFNSFKVRHVIASSFFVLLHAFVDLVLMILAPTDIFTILEAILVILCYHFMEWVSGVIDFRNCEPEV